MSIIPGDIEAKLLQHYNIPSLYPDQWPSEKNEGEDTSDKEEDKKKAAAKARRTKRYTTLERGRGPKNAQGAAGAQGKDGLDRLAEKDEPDPLGSAASVVAVLRHRGLPVENDAELRNRFLMSSTTFSPTLFLSQVHSNDSTDQLLRGLDTLSASIEKKSASLKVLVESNFERFVRAKATIDNVYTEMLNHGTEVDASTTHSRKTSRQSNHFRTPSTQQNQRPIENSKRKNALVKESEYGTSGVKVPLTEATTKAEEVWGPALGGQEREEYLKSVLVSIEQNRSIVEVGAAIEDSIKRRDYEALAEEFGRAQRYRKEALTLANRAREKDTEISDAHMHQILITGRVMVDINRRVEDFKREIWRKLTSVNLHTSSNTPDGKQEEYMELISILLQLGTDENPIWIWLQSRHEHLRARITSSFERMRVDLEIQRRKLASGSRTSSAVLARHLRSALDSKQNSTVDEGIDTRQIVQFWEREVASLNSLLSGKTGLLAEVIEHWETAQAFTNGTKQRGLPVSFDGKSRKHHKLEQKEGEELRQGAIEIFNLFREQLNGLFVDVPVEDVSTLISPSSPTPKTPMTSLFSPTKISRFTFDPKDMPPLSPTKGESWEKFAFWPPHSNSLSAVTFLSRINNIIGLAACDIGAVNIVKKESRLIHHLKNLVVDVREKSIQAVVAAWATDAENCRELEDWTRSTEKPDLTNLPMRFNSFESSMLSNLQKIVYIPEAANHVASPEIILPPPARHIEAVQKGFKNSMYRSFSSMIEHASKSAHGQENARGDMDLTMPLKRDEILSSNGDFIDSSNANVRKLLTVSNFQALRNDVVPSLVSTFESSFLLTITDDAKVARDALSQLHARVFQSYVRPTVEQLRTVVTTGITSPTYAPDTTRPSDARPYVYDVLLRLVFIHTEVSRTASALTGQVLSYLLEQLSVALIDAFKKRPRYSLSALMQATLDVEFLAQTLDNYTTKKAGEVQGEIYQALDERTDNDARQRLQNGLPEMKAILKRLRDKTKGEFGCFKRARKSKGDREKDKDKEREREREREAAY